MDFFNKQGDPIDMKTWVELLDDLNYTTLAITKVESAESDVKHTVSTVWTGINRTPGRTPPIIFETIVLGEQGLGLDLAGSWYATEAEALEGHDAFVRDINSYFGDVFDPETAITYNVRTPFIAGSVEHAENEVEDEPAEQEDQQPADEEMPG